MKLGIFMMPLHPLHRDPAATLQEDREAIILADQLGYYDAFVGEHLTDQAENVTNSFIFGVSPGALLSDAEALGMISEDRNQIFAEAIDVILQIWERDPPYEIDLPGNRFKVTTAKTLVSDIGKGVIKTHEAQDDAELTDDYVVDRLVICGTVNKVVDEILKLREQAGDFGELVYAGMDWLDPKLAQRSMELMATEVMPRVNKAIGAAGNSLRAMAVTGDS